VVRRGPDGIYSSFPAEGPRRLTLGAEAVRTPHLAQVNGRVLAFERAADAPLLAEPLPAEPLPAEPLRASSSAALLPARREAELVRFELDGHVPLELELDGLPPNSECALAFEGRRELGVSDERGALKLALGVARTGEARLYCLVNLGNG
jgi:hypothetical protein